MRIDRKQFSKWIAALRSGKYKQGYGFLQPTKDKYCCLGVACLVIIPKDKLERNNDLIVGGLPESQRHCPKWLSFINGDFAKQTGVSLTVRNDSHEWTFSQIADALEKIYGKSKKYISKKSVKK